LDFSNFSVIVLKRSSWKCNEYLVDDIPVTTEVNKGCKKSFTSTDLLKMHKGHQFH